MDIQISVTPQKSKPTRDPYSTPPHSSTQRQNNQLPHQDGMYQSPIRKNKQNFQTPRKSSHKRQQLQEFELGTPSAVKRKENPQSKKQKPSPFNMKQTKSPGRYDQLQDFQISAFVLSRLEQDYELVQYIGSGHFSQVGLYRSRLTKQLFAIKAAKANRISVNEVQALGSLWMLSGQCPHVVRYYHSWIQEGQLFLVMEYCSDSLQKHIAKHRMDNTPMTQKVVVNYLKAALLGLASIHKYGILHLDVKPQNLLFKGNVLKLADFGLSRAAKIRTGQIEQGDSRYLAREVLNFEPGVDLTKADIFSLAMTVYEMITLEALPNNGKQWLEVRQKGIKVSGRMDLTNYSEGLLNILQRMGLPNWQDRPSALELLEDKMFKNPNRVKDFFGNGKSNKKRQVSL